MRNVVVCVLLVLTVVLAGLPTTSAATASIAYGRIDFPPCPAPSIGLAEAFVVEDADWAQMLLTIQDAYCPMNDIGPVLFQGAWLPSGGCLEGPAGVGWACLELTNVWTYEGVPARTYDIRMCPELVASGCGEGLLVLMTP